MPERRAPVALRHDTIRRGVEIDGRVSIADHETSVVAGRRRVSQSITNVRNRLKMFAIA